jgi:hypothetical protein
MDTLIAPLKGFRQKFPVNYEFIRRNAGPEGAEGGDCQNNTLEAQEAQQIPSLLVPPLKGPFFRERGSLIS